MWNRLKLRSIMDGAYFQRWCQTWFVFNINHSSTISRLWSWLSNFFWRNIFKFDFWRLRRCQYDVLSVGAWWHNIGLHFAIVLIFWSKLINFCLELQFVLLLSWYFRVFIFNVVQINHVRCLLYWWNWMTCTTCSCSSWLASLVGDLLGLIELLLDLYLFFLL